MALAGCAAVPLDPSLPVGPPSRYNADPDRYDQQKVYVRGTLWTLGHWWRFNLYEPGEKHIGNLCLNLKNVTWLSDHRSAMNGRRVVVKGMFVKGAWKEALGGCDGNDNGLLLDEEFLRRHYHP